MLTLQCDHIDDSGESSFVIFLKGVVVVMVKCE